MYVSYVHVCLLMSHIYMYVYYCLICTCMLRVGADILRHADYDLNFMLLKNVPDVPLFLPDNWKPAKANLATIDLGHEHEVNAHVMRGDGCSSSSFDSGGWRFDTDLEIKPKALMTDHAGSCATLDLGIGGAGVPPTAIGGVDLSFLFSYANFGVASVHVIEPEHCSSDIAFTLDDKCDDAVGAMRILAHAEIDCTWESRTSQTSITRVGVPKEGASTQTQQRNNCRKLLRVCQMKTTDSSSEPKKLKLFQVEVLP